MSWILFRACVALRQILAVRKPKPLPRSRKAAAIAGICFAVVNGVRAGDEIPLPATSGDAGQRLIDFDAQRIRSIREISTSIAPPAGELPENFARRRFAEVPTTLASQVAGRGWPEYTYAWLAPVLCYRPLYFEEPNLERYGHRAALGLQSAVSAVHFGAAVALLPVRMALERPWTRSYSLGHARPGSAAAWERH